MSRFYLRDGTPIPDMIAWARIFEEQLDYRRVAESWLEDGTWISTVWLGLDHQWGAEGPPLIFETMVFSAKLEQGVRGEQYAEQDCERYSTEAEAFAGHERMVARWAEIKKVRVIPRGAELPFTIKTG